MNREKKRRKKGGWNVINGWIGKTKSVMWRRKDRWTSAENTKKRKGRYW